MQDTQWMTPEQINEYQFMRLKKLVTHAYETVPFYRKLYDEHAIRPDDIKNIDDFTRLPLITREDIRSAGDRLRSSAYSKHTLIHGHTSGTTGSPLSFYWDKETCIYTNAVDWRQKAWAGVEYGEKLAMFLGRTIVPVDKKNPPFWQLDRFHNMLWMSSFHLGEKYFAVLFRQTSQIQSSGHRGLSFHDLHSRQVFETYRKPLPRQGGLYILGDIIADAKRTDRRKIPMQGF